MKRFFKYLIIFLIAISNLQAIGYSEELPLWELGFGIAALNLPDYRGSDERHFYFLPLPYLIYRGKFLKVDKDGIYGDLFKSDRINLDLSLSAGVPVKSNGNAARSGMPDLDPTFGIGPSLGIQLYSNDTKDRVLSFRLSARADFATDLSQFRSVGWIINPYLNFNVRKRGSGNRWNIGILLGPLFATEGSHDYYYEVPSKFSTPSRPAFDARGGYSGARLAMAIRKRFGRLWMGTFGLYDNLNGAVFENSPLVKKKHSFMAGLGIVWVFAESKTLTAENIF